MASVARLNGIGLPKFTEKMDPADARAIWNYLYQSREQTVHILSNLDSSNMSDEAKNEYDGMLSRLYSLELGEGGGGSGSTGSSTGEILTRLGAVESRLARAEGNLEALTGRVIALETETQTQAGQIAALQSALNALTQRVQALETPTEGEA